MNLRPVTIGNIAVGGTSLKRVRRTTILLFASFLLLIVLAVILHLADQYNDAVDGAMRDAHAAARTAKSFGERTMGEANRVAEGVADVYREHIRLQRFNEYELHTLMAAKLRKLPQAATIYLMDPDKKLLVAGRRYPAIVAGPVTFDPSGYTDEGDDSPFVGDLYQSSANSPDGTKFYLPVGQRIVDNGRTIGYVVAILRPEYFAAFFDTIDVGDRGTLEMWRTDGLLMAATKTSPHHTGDRRPEFTRFFQTGQIQEAPPHLADAVGAGYSRRVVAVDGIIDSPLSMLVALDGADYLRSWRDSRNRIGLVMVVVFVVMIATGLFIFGQLKRSEQNETELRRAKASAEEANEAKSRFLAHMSHEFRTPLNAIMGFSEIIKNKVLGEGVSPVYVSYADHIHKSGEHLLNIVNDILDMAKIESGIQPINRESVDVASAIRSAIAFVERLASERGLHIVVNVPSNLPHVSADERYLRQVLINLLTNATKFSSPGLEIGIEARRHDKGLDISVSDHGPGIDPALMRRIGEPFLQGNPTVSRAGQGAGLGLSICKQYMDLLGGELLIASQPNHGTTASVRFPPALLVDGVAAAAE